MLLTYFGTVISDRIRKFLEHEHLLLKHRWKVHLCLSTSDLLAVISHVWLLACDMYNESHLHMLEAFDRTGHGGVVSNLTSL